MSDPEYFKELQRERTKHNRIFMGAVVGLLLCLTTAFEKGSGSGWPWLVGSVALLFLALWSLIEARHAHLLMQIHLSGRQ
jgi:hypothetical protein